jgi:hypothetical protein
MAYRRDLIGHFIRTDQTVQRPCTHACCRGYRVHPANMPVILPARTLRNATDDDLAQHFRTVSATGTTVSRRAEAQILHEMERRDRAETRRDEREQEKRRRWEARAASRAAARMDREAETGRIRVEAETVTRGVPRQQAGPGPRHRPG